MVLIQKFGLASKFFQNHVELVFQIHTLLRFLNLQHVLSEHVTHGLERCKEVRHWDQRCVHLDSRCLCLHSFLLTTIFFVWSSRLSFLSLTFLANLNFVIFFVIVFMFALFGGFVVLFKLFISKAFGHNDERILLKPFSVQSLSFLFSYLAVLYNMMLAIHCHIVGANSLFRNFTSICCNQMYLSILHYFKACNQL